MKDIFKQPHCFRVTDACSVSPYSAQYGYTANDTIFNDYARAPVSQRAYKAEISTPSWDDMEVLEDVKDHILGGWHSILDDDHTRSKWISTRESRRAIWETARRLVSNRVGEVCMGSVVQRLSYSRKYRGTRMIGIDAVSYLHERGYRQSHECFRFARSSSEILWYGRIFPKDISHVEYSTLDTPGDNLFSQYLVPEYERRSDRWIDDLVWDLAVDTFYEASDKISDRIMDMEYDDDEWY